MYPQSSAFFAPTEPPDDYFQIMADSGLTHAEFGTESLSDKVIASYEKPFKADNVFKAHNSAKNAGVHIAHYLLLGGPGEDCDSLKQTLSNLDKLDRTVLFFFCGMRIYPHTKLYEIAVEQGQISKFQSILEPVFYQSEMISSQEIIQRVKEHDKERMNWVIGSGGDRTAEIISRMYDRGFSGPLWEYLIR